MKTVILIISLMYNAFCIGQMPDSSSIWYSTKNLKKDTIPSYESYMQKLSILSRTVTPFDSITIYGNEEPVYHRKRDTVPVILIVIDTSSRISLLMIITDPLSKAKSDGRLPFWIKGYSVRELHNKYDDLKGGPTSFVPSVGYFEPNYWKHIYYLDADKIPLSKSIIVFGEKEIQ